MPQDPGYFANLSRLALLRRWCLPSSVKLNPRGRCALDSPSAIRQSASVTPVLIVSGFLGSGKTSLVRWLLADAKREGKRVAVVSNEFNALGIDQALLEVNSASVMQLDGGCVCCQLSDELVATLETLRRNIDPDQIIIETSGVALPGDTQVQLWREPLKSWVEENTAVVVVDAAQVLDERDLDGTFEFQATSADLLVLNKLDLVPETALPAIEARLRAIEPDAPLIRAVHGRVDALALFPPKPGAARRRQSNTLAATHAHESFTSRVAVVEAGIAESVVIERFQKSSHLRAKGFVHTATGLRLLQAVGGRVQLQHVTAMPEPVLVGKVVVIERVR